MRASITLLTKAPKVSSAYSSSGRLARPKEKRRLNIDISSLSDMLGWLFITPSAHMRVTTSVIPTQVLTFSSGLRLRGERGSTSCIHCIGGQSLQKKFDENLRIMPGSQDKGQEQPEEEAQLPVFRPKMLGKVVVGSVRFTPPFESAKTQETSSNPAQFLLRRWSTGGS